MQDDSIALTAAQIETFIHDGYVRIEQAFPRRVADACRALLWEETGMTPDDPSTWTEPVVRIGEQAHPIFREAIDTPRLRAAFDALVGEGRWLPRASLGTFPIRFPSPRDPGDCGWHVDMSFGWETEPDFLEWRINVHSKGRALLMLFLFSDVGDQDAPTRLRVGSHVSIARRLGPHGEAGLSLRELASTGFDESAHLPERLAIGKAGTVYLCHPFLVHAAQVHRGRTPRFMAQPPLFPRSAAPAVSADGNLPPVARAIRVALSGQ